MLEEIQENEITTPDKVKKSWKSKLENKTLDVLDFINYFQISAPYFLTIPRKDDNEIGTCSFDEDGAKAAIIDIVQEIILGNRWEETLAQLKTSNNVSSVCGNIFKNGEPTYSCRECSMDPTCVLCATCFKKSTHRNHKYRMSTSFGGGCCDCGDQEAWKKDYYCEDHAPVEKPELDALITEEMKEICGIVFRAILAYSVNQLQIDSDTNVPDIESDANHEDVYCTLLYNDETHTFDQVINTLTSIVKCEQKEAVEYVTSIDRDGRSVVKCATFNACMKLKNEIEKKGMRTTLSSSAKIQPLKVAIFHKNTVACQAFALQALHWFQEFLGYSAKFRSVFCDIVLTSNPSTNYSLRQILLYDIKLWKTARSAWHRLIISGMLMEYENKKELAINFTKVYANIMQDFLRDDHYHSYSVVSLSVQLFTVPTIAHHLIAQEAAFFKLMHTYYSECIEKYIKNRVLVFPKNAATTFNKRAHFIITDLRYLLTFKPDNWTQDLRLGFLHGVQIVLRLLKCMQGMDSVTRQVGQHMEYEPEWESAFTLHIKLSALITAIIDWASTDKVILIKVYRMVLLALNETKFIVSDVTPEVKELADHSATCLMYDVSSKPVSIHLPLTRLLAGLYVHLQKFNLTFDNVSTTTDKPSAEQIIEPVLCTRTMISQVYAGMWRRNGYSLLNQLYFYRNVKCRSEMLDRDIVILQMGASLIESNEFLIHIMSKFNLIQWTEKDYKPALVNSEEDTIRQIVNMIDEFLELLIVIIGERYLPGIGQITDDDRIKKEIIQQLCIKPLSHSELNKALNDEHNGGHDNDIEPVIHEIATFEKATSADKKGVYKLKEEHFNDFNMYFYHYTREEKSKSEEMQRSRHKSRSELICCPPPKLPQLTEPFMMIANLLQCDVMLLIMKTVLTQSTDLNCQTFSEGHLQKILHLIGYGIQEEESGNYQFLQFLERSSKMNLLSLMEELLNSPRVESQRDFLIWTIKKYKDQQAANNKHHETSEISSTATSSAAIVESDTQMETEQAMKERRAKMAALRREKLLADMAKAQNKFISSNAEHFKDDIKIEDDSSMEWQSSMEEQKKIACIGNDRKIAHNEAETSTCILCSEEATNNRSCMVYPAFIQKSNVLGHHKTAYAEDIQSPDTELKASPYINSCGHEMHVGCHQEYFINEMQKEQRRPFRTRNPNIFNVDKKQFLCPLCRFLSNAVLPIVPPLTTLSDGKAKCVTDAINFDLWFQLMTNYINSLQFIRKDFRVLQDGLLIRENYQECVVGFLKEHCDFKQTEEEQLLNIDPETNKFSKDFMVSTKKISPTSGEVDDLDLYTYAFNTCAYTIEVLEMFMRATDKPLPEMSVRYRKCISALVRLCGYYGRMNFEILKDKNDDSSITSYYALLLCAREVYDTLFGRKPDLSILEWDIFNMMVSLLFITRPVLFPQNQEYLITRGDSLDFTIFETMFAANLLKILLTVKLSNDYYDEMDYEDGEDSQSLSGNQALTAEEQTIVSIYEKYNIYRDPNSFEENKNKLKRQLIQELKDQSRTYMRCSCILFHFLTEVSLPDEMAQGNDTFEVMADYLNVNKNVLNYFADSNLLTFLQQCAQHNGVINYRNKVKAGEEMTSVVEVNPKIRELRELPDDYSDLMNSVSLFTCRNNEREDSRNPTMCLVCGEILCSQTYCCQREINKVTVGACNYHTEVCGLGAGIFLRIRDAEILLLGQNTGCFSSAPYLDDYGETDQGLRRGNPLHLCRESYKKLQQTWLSHSIHEEIARKTESQSNIFQIQWNHL